MRHFVGVLLLTVLAACTAAPKPPPAEREPVARTVAPKPVEAPRRKAPVIVERPEPQKPPQKAAVPPPRTKAINDDPKQLYGLDGQKVANLLGPAGFVRRDGPAEVWQYRAEACVLDVYLYREAGRLTVAHVDLRKRQKASLPPRRCFRGILTRAG